MPDLFGGADKKTRPSSVTIGRSLGETYSFLRRFENHARFMKNVRTVETHGQRTRWVSAPDAYAPEEWETEVVGEEKNRWFAWRTVGGTPLAQVSAITVEDAPNGRGTVVSLKVAFEDPVGKAAGFAGKILGQDPDTQAYTNLRRLKALLETAEIPTVEGQPSGREAGATEATPAQLFQNELEERKGA